MSTLCRLAVVLTVNLLALAPAVAGAQVSQPQQERIAASFILARGRAPTGAELEQWAEQQPASIADLLARHRAELQADAAAQRQVAARAALDAFGRAATGAELAPDAAAGYMELMNRHLGSLRAQPAEYEQVLRRAYRLVVRREAYPEEIDYWRERGTLPFALVAACLEDWMRRNQPGLMVTTGTPTVSASSRYLVTAPLAPAIANEARAAAGLPGVSRGPQEENPGANGRNLVAAGAEAIVTGGHRYFAAAGADTLATGGR